MRFVFPRSDITSLSRKDLTVSRAAAAQTSTTSASSSRAGPPPRSRRSERRRPTLLAGEVATGACRIVAPANRRRPALARHWQRALFPVGAVVTYAGCVQATVRMAASQQSIKGRQPWWTDVRPASNARPSDRSGRIPCVFSQRDLTRRLDTRFPFTRSS
jgi:hypothetical protein